MAELLAIIWSSPLYIILFLAAVNWLMPLLLWLYPLGMMLLFKDFEFKGFYGPFAKFQLANKDVEPWHAKRWKDWAGTAFYWFMCYRDRPGEYDDEWVARTLKHEGEHCKHGALLGALFGALYIGHSGFIWITQKIKGKPYTKHAYLDNWSERLARKKAGQIVDIPPEDWLHGKDDLWPWW